MWNGPKKVWNRWPLRIKTNAIVYILLVLIQVVVRVQIENLEVWKKNVKWLKRCEQVHIEDFWIEVNASVLYSYCFLWSRLKIWSCEKRSEIATKQYKIVYIELAGCLLYESCPYQNISDQQTRTLVYEWIDLLIHLVHKWTDTPNTISQKFFPRGALIFQ